MNRGAEVPNCLDFCAWNSRQHLLDEDGLHILLDGKHTIQALAELQAEHAAAKPGEGEEWPAALVEVFTQGVDVADVEFEGGHADARLAYCVAAHDVDSNKYKASALRDLVAVAQRFRAREPGGD